MSALILADVMDAISAEIVSAGVVTKAHAYPVGSVTPPCAVVGYPETIDFDAVFGRGSDKAEFPLWVIVGKVHDKSARDAISKLITGATGIKDALDGDLGGAVQTCHVTDCKIEEIQVGDITYLSAKFMLEIYS